MCVVVCVHAAADAVVARAVERVPPRGCCTSSLVVVSSRLPTCSYWSVVRVHAGPRRHYSGARGATTVNVIKPSSVGSVIALVSRRGPPWPPCENRSCPACRPAGYRGYRLPGVPTRVSSAPPFACRDSRTRGFRSVTELYLRGDFVRTWAVCGETRAVGPLTTTACITPTLIINVRNSKVLLAFTKMFIIILFFCKHIFG